MLESNQARVAITIGAATTLLGIYYLFSSWREQINALQQANQTLQDEVAKQKKLREDERLSRIALQRNQRSSVQASLIDNGYTYQAIGHVESPFREKRGTPRQPLLVPSSIGMIKFNKKIIQYSHFEELKEFSHIWVLFVFSENTDIEKNSRVAKIRPPRLHGEKVGCLSTRSPHRPNNIGLSVCEVLSVTPEGIQIKCIDMVDQTPVLDGKLYYLQ